jgi:ADP-ribose pyrophosphatase
MSGADPKGTVVFPGRLITVRVRPVTGRDGATHTFEIVEHPDAVAIVAVRDTEEGERLVAFVRQDRPAIGRATWEIPAGLVGPADGGDTRRTAERELLEETGMRAGTLLFLHKHYPSPGFSNEAISIYLATDLDAVDDAEPDPAEIDGVSWKPLGVAIDMCRRGEIEDGKTVIGLWLARDALSDE